MRLLLVILALTLQTAFSQLTATLHRTSSPTIVTLEIQNTYLFPVALLRYNLPLDPRFGGVNNFRVYLDGEPVPYIGAVVKYADPDLSEYIILNAQEKVTTTVVLHDLYDFTKLGDYIVQFDHFVEDYAMDFDVASIPRKRVDFAPSDILTSNEIGITVTKPYPQQVRAPYPCSNQEYNTILDAADSLVDMINTAQDLISQDDTDTYIEWFGVFLRARWVIVEEAIRLIRLNTVVDYACDDMANVFAYVYPNDPTHTIYLCSVFWDVNKIGGYDTQAGTLLHELSHFSNIGGTGDWAYGTGACRSLAINNPANAINNADSYEYFGESSF
jgi:peptidyl-Lys metalloendopeptidase